MIETIRQGLKDDGYTVSISQLCRWFGIPRRTVYYKATKKPPTVQERFATPIKQMIEEHPSFGYRTVAYLLKFNKNTVQRIFQLMHWQVRKRPVGFRPRVELCRQSRAHRTSDGRRTCVASGAVVMAGRCSPWSSTVAHGSCWAGICLEVDDRRPRRRRSNKR